MRGNITTFLGSLFVLPAWPKFAPLVVTQVVSFLVWGMLDVAKQRRREEEAERQARPWQQMAFGFDEPRELG